MHVRMCAQLHPIYRIAVLRFLLQSAAIRLSALHISPFFFFLLIRILGCMSSLPLYDFCFLLLYHFFITFYLIYYLFIRIMPTGTEMILHLVGDKEKERKNK